MFNLILIILLALVVAVTVRWLHRRLKLVEKAEGIEAAPYPINEMRVRQLIADALKENSQ